MTIELNPVKCNFYDDRTESVIERKIEKPPLATEIQN